MELTHIRSLTNHIIAIGTAQGNLIYLNSNQNIDWSEEDDFLYARSPDKRWTISVGPDRYIAVQSRGLECLYKLSQNVYSDVRQYYLSQTMQSMVIGGAYRSRRR